MAQAFIVDYLRSPFALARKGDLAGIRPDDLAAGVVAALVERSGVDPELVEDVILGCAFPEGEQGFNIARCVVLLAGLPQSVGGSTVNRWCGSSMQAVQTGGRRHRHGSRRGLHRRRRRGDDAGADDGVQPHAQSALGRCRACGVT